MADATEGKATPRAVARVWTGVRVGTVSSEGAASTVRTWPTLEAHARRHEAWWLRRGVGPYLILVDVLAFTLATVITLPGSAVAHGLALVCLLLVFWRAGLYRSRLELSLLDDLPYVLAAVVVAWTFKVALFSVLPGVDPPVQQVVHVVVLLAVLLAARGIAYRVVHTARCRGVVRHRTLIVGAGPVGVRIANTLLERRNYGLDPLGFLDADLPEDTRALLPIPLLGGYEQLGAVIRELGARDVIVAYGGVDEDELVDILRTCDRLDVEVFVVPRLFELHNANRHTDEIWGIPLLRVRRAVYRSPWWRVKRLIDVVVSALTLLVISPVLVACAVAVRYEGGPGIIFRQERVGLDGRPFQVLKLRSLKPVNETESQTNWNIKHDDRLGPVGRFLRATSLDELPQLWNILRGDMSLVGPRPERPHFVQQFSTHIPRYTARHRVPAGLTGWAQAHGLRGDTSIEDRARFDNYYIENWSPWLDMKIVLKTVGQVLRRQGG
ncbi:sugar transferase [Geodermatophilus obscurus]|uniref:Exopolysaccharide biosynthesis polyprenyl glycosylphosphotransferase n=1 Tax=Geodermatophilus obscurus (strain ATCC 25078 / DSM 43160 / JCM 3152 / CCUG 61914 / KCC A-0152 / KCTC 9177 / NBRC 13315 / NRRL B-3577 / G-20) TaxID=526225 RepID=D2S592_GEOOG|nr:sugar transferase [Geodermatophilus obscurus]ADB73203.1 exopolysaccharide biosynthesis polyprenyl glycosylphosphotransferase [Geodermatophilus obscurus DSM 43160]